MFLILHHFTFQIHLTLDIRKKNNIKVQLISFFRSWTSFGKWYHVEILQNSVLLPPSSLRTLGNLRRAIAANCSVMGFTPEKQFQLIAVGNKLEINPNNFQSSVLCAMQSRIVCHCRNTNILNTEYHPFSPKIGKLILSTKTIHFLCWLVLRNLESYQAHLIDNFLQSRNLSAFENLWIIYIPITLGSQKSKDLPPNYMMQFIC